MMWLQYKDGKFIQSVEARPDTPKNTFELTILFQTFLKLL